MDSECWENRAAAVGQGPPKGASFGPFRTARGGSSRPYQPPPTRTAWVTALTAWTAWVYQERIGVRHAGHSMVCPVWGSWGRTRRSRGTRSGSSDAR
jgi:hypothetical protein